MDYETKLRLGFHDTSMSSDPGTAATGRCLKALFDHCDRYMDEENRRGTDPRGALVSLAFTCGVIVAGGINAITFTEPEKFAEVAKKAFCQALDAYMKTGPALDELRERAMS